MGTGQRPARLGHRTVRRRHADGPLAAVDEGRLPVTLAVTPEGLDRCPAALPQRRLEVGICDVGQNAPRAGNGAQQLVKLPLYRLEVLVDVGVIEFQVVQHEGPRPVVHELGALVEEGRVVFVGFDDEVAAAAEARGHAEVGRNAADQETRLEAGAFEDPGEQTRGRRLAVGPGDSQDVFVVQDVTGKPCRTGLVVEFTVQHRLDGGTGTAKGAGVSPSPEDNSRCTPSGSSRQCQPSPARRARAPCSPSVAATDSG